MNTQDSRGHRHVTESVVRMLRQREFSEDYTRPFQKAAHVTEGMIKRLGPIHELQGHKGCVNCLEWSEDGRLLISGSDDTKVIIWDAMRKKQLTVIPTRHVGNIFSVKFLPRTNCSQIVTGAGDTFVTVMNVEHGSTKSSKPTPLLHCRCHGGRVKRIATAPDLPDIFWSAGEDGLVLQFDLREPHVCTGGRSESEGSNGGVGCGSVEGRSGRMVLIDLCRHAGWHAEAKCISVNPVKPHLIAVGANDSYARLYDRRMIKTSPFRGDRGVDTSDRNACLARVSVPDESVPIQSARYFTPGHLGVTNNNGEENTPDRNFKLATTYVAFSPFGNELLVNLGGDHIYLYDINNTNNYSHKLSKPPKINDDNGIIHAGDTRTNGIVLKTCCSTLNESFPIEEMSFDDVPGKPNNVPTLSPECSCQYITRADNLMRRKWLGDYYAAARDYLIALNMRGGVRSSKGRRPLVGVVYALTKLKWWKAAKAWMLLLREYHAKSSSEYTRLEEALQKSNNEFCVLPNALQHEDQIHKSQQETTWRTAAGDYQSRFVGHCNTTTDIKEVAFIGPTGNYIAAGSDDGVLYVWKRDNSALVTAYHADTSIVNCVQPHPSTFLIATSGIEAVVKLWQPLSDNDLENGKHVVSDIWQAAESNQQRIAMNPFETMIVNLGYEVDMINPRHLQQMPCQTS